MSKFTFVATYSWSDHPDGGEYSSGQLPCAVLLPDGERVELDDTEIQCARFNLDRLNPTWYVPLHENVRVRESGGGDDPARHYGRGYSKLEIQAPGGSRFLFARPCPWCAEKAGEQELSADLNRPEADPLFHPACLKRHEAFQAEIREQEEADCREREAWETHLHTLGYIV